MNEKSGHTESALQAWASQVMSGSGAVENDRGAVARAPGHAHYDPADVISVFMTARESAKARQSADAEGTDTTGTTGTTAAEGTEA